MMEKTIIVLANSRKYHGHCIAGKDIHCGKWIRIISDIDNRNIPSYYMEKVSWDFPSFGDILRLELDGPIPKEHHKEDFLLTKKPWVYLSQINEVEKYLDPCESLWDIYSCANRDRVPYSLIHKIKDSLRTISVKGSDVKFLAQKNIQGKLKARVFFSYHDKCYNFPITDFRYVNDEGFFRQGRRPHLKNNDIVYLTISLGEHYKGYYYKLVAGVKIRE